MMKILIGNLALLSATSVYTIANAGNSPVGRRVTNLAVDLGYGVYKGVCSHSTELNVWKGIRYAAPPLGDNRWRAPQPPTSNRTVVNATIFGPNCPQALPAVPSQPLIPGNEDCLFLNLGAFGFLSSLDVDGSGIVNAGIVDMAFALEWVQKHIQFFGGDKTKVTISGESAGGGAVILLSIAKDGALGTSLFRAGISSSTYLPPQYEFDASILTQRYRDFASQAGCNGTGILVCLRGKDSTTLQQANAAVNSVSTYGTWAFLPVTDSGFITSTPSKALTAKKVNGVNILVGNNANEGTLFVPSGVTTETDLRAWLKQEFPSFNVEDVQQVLDAYPTKNVTNSSERSETNGVNGLTALDVSQIATGQQQRAYNIYAEATFVCPSYWLNDAYNGNGRSSYHYQYSIPFASHGGDVRALFGPAQLNKPASFTSVFRKIWGDFIRHENSAIAQAGAVKWVSGPGAQMGNLNTTAGTPSQIATQYGVNVMQYQEPGLKKDISLVNAWSWEGDRGKR